MNAGLWWSAWAVRHEDIAIRELGFTDPQLFWRLTIREFHMMLDGHRHRKRDDLEWTAKFVCAIANRIPFQGKNAKAMRPESLIGISPERREAARQRRTPSNE